MTASCTYLIELKLRGWRGLTGASMAFVIRNFRFLENVDILSCSGTKERRRGRRRTVFFFNYFGVKLIKTSIYFEDLGLKWMKMIKRGRIENNRIRMGEGPDCSN